MRYMLMFAGDATAGMSDDETQAAATAMEGCDEWTEEMRRRGYLRGGAGLRPSVDATTLKVRDGQVLVSDGPFAETRDQIGGFNMIECPSLDEALDAAARHPWARVGQVEVRPVWEQ